MPTLAEHACLALVAEGVDHGWAIGGLLARDGELGRIWSLSRPLTYRAIDSLVDQGLLKRAGPAAGRGRARSPLRLTAAGRRTSSAWLSAPVEHLRDVRTELLLKLALRRRAGLDAVSLAVAQRERFGDAFAALTSSDPDDDLVAVWRREHARAVRRFLDAVAGGSPAASVVAGGSPLRLSARNQITATALAVTHGDVMSTIKVALPDGQQLTAAITRDAAEELDLAPGDPVVVVVKSTEVMIAR
ncbi:hypothetical protein BH24ACT6_BH24ACT6_11300 [soil metagenome]